MATNCSRSFLAISVALGLILGLPLIADADDVRTIWDGGGDGVSFTDPNNWNAPFDPTLPGGNPNQLPGYEAGAPSNNINQTPGATPTVNSAFTPAFFFSPLILRNGGNMTVNANMNISGTSILVAQTGSGGLPSLLTHNAGTITSGSVEIGSGNGTYRMAGGTLTSSGNLTLNPGAGFSSTFWVDNSSPTINIAGNMVLGASAGDSTIRFDLDPISDSVTPFNITGLLDLSGANDTLHIDFNSLSPGLDNGDDIVLFDYGTLSGTFDNITFYGGYGVVDYAFDDGGNLVLAILNVQVLPEPSTMMLLGLGGWVLLRARKKLAKSQKNIP